MAQSTATSETTETTSTPSSGDIPITTYATTSLPQTSSPDSLTVPRLIPHDLLNSSESSHDVPKPVSIPLASIEALPSDSTVVSRLIRQDLQRRSELESPANDVLLEPEFISNQLSDAPTPEVPEEILEPLRHIFSDFINVLGISDVPCFKSFGGGNIGLRSLDVPIFRHLSGLVEKHRQQTGSSTPWLDLIREISPRNNCGRSSQFSMFPSQVVENSLIPKFQIQKHRFTQKPGIYYGSGRKLLPSSQPYGDPELASHISQYFRPEEVATYSYKSAPQSILPYPPIVLPDFNSGTIENRFNQFQTNVDLDNDSPPKPDSSFNLRPYKEETFSAHSNPVKLTQQLGPYTVEKFSTNSKTYQEPYTVKVTQHLGPYTVQRISQYSSKVPWVTKSKPSLSVERISTDSKLPSEKDNEQIFSTHYVGPYTVQRISSHPKVPSWEYNAPKLSTHHLGPYNVPTFSSYSKMPSALNSKEDSEPNIGSYNAQSYSAQSHSSFGPDIEQSATNSEQHLTSSKEHSFSPTDQIGPYTVQQHLRPYLVQRYTPWSNIATASNSRENSESNLDLTSFKKQTFSPTYQLGPYTLQRSSTHSKTVSGQSREDDSKPHLSSYAAQSNAPLKLQNEESISKSQQLGSYTVQSMKNLGPYTVQKFSSHHKMPSRASIEKDSDPNIGSYTAQSVKSNSPFEPLLIINSEPH